MSLLKMRQKRLNVNQRVVSSIKFGKASSLICLALDKMFPKKKSNKLKLRKPVYQIQKKYKTSRDKKKKFLK